MTFVFAFPLGLLVGVGVVVLLAATRVSRFSRGSVTTPEAGIFKDLPRSWRQRNRWILVALRCAALVLLGLALARPQAQRIIVPESRDTIDVVLVVDTSSSMSSRDFEQENRLDVAKRIIAEFVARRSGDRLGMIAFARYSTLRCPLTTDHAILTDQIASTDMARGEDDGTAIGMALASAVNHLRRSPSTSKVVVLLTDGENNRSTIDPATGAELARLYGVRVHTVGVGKEIADGVVEAAPDGLRPQAFDERGLKQIAETTAGQYFRAGDPAGLEAIFQEIDLLERSPAVEERRIVVAEYFQIPALLALAMILGEHLLRHGALRRLP